MPITMIQRGDNRDSALERILNDIAAKLMPIALVVTIALFGWLLFGLFSGRLADVPKMPAADRLEVLALIGKISLGIKIGLTLTLLSVLVMYYDFPMTGYVLLGLAALFTYGVQFGIAYVEGDPTRLFKGKAAGLAFGTLQASAVMLAIPGVTLILRSMYQRIREGRKGEDLTQLQYGGASQKEKVSGPVLGVLAKCWQLPFCREGIRVNCPIYHARTKCWKQRVGCMCEENIIRIAMGDKREVSQDLTKQGGFVPLGDLITKNQASQKSEITTRGGPRGVRIPTNPHLTDRQKTERCRNCVIYNEHQRYKYQFLSPPVTLAVPLLIYLNFDSFREAVDSGMHLIDKAAAHISFQGAQQVGTSDLTRNVTGSLPIETIIIVCLGLVTLSWVLRGLEYCIFKIKI